MKLEEKLWYLKENHSREFYQTREKVFEEMSDAQPIVCKCGRLATGFHERNCTRFNRAVDSRTCALLKDLWMKGKPKEEK